MSHEQGDTNQGVGSYYDSPEDKEIERLQKDYARLKDQLRMCERHAATMAKDFDASLAVVQAERDQLQAEAVALKALVAGKDEALVTISSWHPTMGSRGEYRQGQLDILDTLAHFSKAKLSPEIAGQFVRREVLEEAKTALDTAAGLFDDMDAMTWNEDSDFQGSSYSGVSDLVNTALSSAEAALAGGAQ